MQVDSLCEERARHIIQDVRCGPVIVSDIVGHGIDGV